MPQRSQRASLSPRIRFRRKKKQATISNLESIFKIVIRLKGARFRFAKRQRPID
jgi:hypothetical protein